jgi:hypothetical protein
MTATRPYHHGNLRDALLREGERALEAGGAGGLSLREVARAGGGRGPRCDDRLAALARAYVRFARRHGALLELMFAAKHEADAPPALREAGERAFAPALAVVAEGQAAGEVVGGDTERVAMVAFATMHGLVSMANSGMVDEAAVDDLVGDVVERLVLGLRPRPDHSRS